MPRGDHSTERKPPHCGRSGGPAEPSASHSLSESSSPLFVPDGGWGIRREGAPVSVKVPLVGPRTLSAGTRKLADHRHVQVEDGMVGRGEQVRVPHRATGFSSYASPPLPASVADALHFASGEDHELRKIAEVAISPSSLESSHAGFPTCQHYPTPTLALVPAHSPLHGASRVSSVMTAPLGVSTRWPFHVAPLSELSTTMRAPSPVEGSTVTSRSRGRSHGEGAREPCTSSGKDEDVGPAPGHTRDEAPSVGVCGVSFSAAGGAATRSSCPASLSSSGTVGAAVGLSINARLVSLASHRRVDVAKTLAVHHTTPLAESVMRTVPRVFSEEEHQRVMMEVQREERHLNYPNTALPAEYRNDGDTEERRRRLEQRRKQVAYGKDTDGYHKYRTMVPRVEEREYHNILHPVTPRPENDCSKRAFDKYLNAWRRQLHQWDLCNLERITPEFMPLGVATLGDLGLAGPVRSQPPPNAPTMQSIAHAAISSTGSCGVSGLLSADGLHECRSPNAFSGTSTSPHGGLSSVLQLHSGRAGLTSMCTPSRPQGPEGPEVDAAFFRRTSWVESTPGTGAASPPAQRVPSALNLSRATPFGCGCTPVNQGNRGSPLHHSRLEAPLMTLLHNSYDLMPLSTAPLWGRPASFGGHPSPQKPPAEGYAECAESRWNAYVHANGRGMQSPPYCGSVHPCPQPSAIRCDAASFHASTVPRCGISPTNQKSGIQAEWAMKSSEEPPYPSCGPQSPPKPPYAGFPPAQ